MDDVSATASFQPQLPHDLGDYVLLEEIGRGGMGVIYKARQCCLDRLCAVKMLRPGPNPASPQAEAALRAEAAAAARLDHPNIVGIYEVGRADGHLFFSMEFVPGEDLSRYVRTRILDTRTIASLARKIAGAIAYAHARGVMHHDLKPANVVMDPDGEPQVTDFGLARRIDEVHRIDPAHGAGSPNYLSPEQASARFGDPGLQTDVFGLGAILYFLLTDHPPFDGVTLEDTLRAVLETDPVDPRALRSGLPVDLATICLRCLEKQPARRYASIREVAEELDRFLEDKPILARPAGLAERGRRMFRRHPVITALASTVGVLISIIAFGSSVAAFRVNEARQRAESSERQTRRNLYNADLLIASAAYADGQDGQVRRILQGHLPRGRDADLRGWEWRFLHHASQGDSTGILGRCTSTIVQLQPCRDGRHVVSAEIGGTLAVWNTAAPGGPVARITLTPVGAPIPALAHHANLLAALRRSTTSTNDTLAILTLPGLESDREFPLEGRYTAGAWTPDDASIWLLGTDSIARIDATTGKTLTRHPIRRARKALDFAFSPNGRWLAFAQIDDQLGILDLADGSRIASLQGHTPNPVWGATYNCIRFSPDGHTIATAGSDGTVRLWSMNPPRPTHTLRGHSDLVASVAFAPDQSCLASVGRDGFVQIIPLDSTGNPGDPLRLRGAEPVQTAVTLLPGTPAPLSAGIDGTIRLWHPKPQERLPTLTRLPAGSADLGPLANGTDFVARRGDAGLNVGRVADGTLLFVFDPTPDTVAATAEHPAKGELILATLDTSGRVTFGAAHQPMSTHATRTLSRPPTGRRTMELSLSRDARRLAVGDTAAGVEILNTPRLDTLAKFDGHPERMVFSTSARWFAIGEIGGGVRVFDLDHPDAPGTNLVHPQHSGLAFSPDEQHLATVAYDGTIHLWDLEAGREIARLQSGTSHLLSVQWSEDASRLFVGGLGGALSVWDLESRRETMVLRLHTQPITAIQHQPDGALRTFGPDAIRTWPAP